MVHSPKGLAVGALFESRPPLGPRGCGHATTISHAYLPRSPWSDRQRLWKRATTASPLGVGAGILDWPEWTARPEVITRSEFQSCFPHSTRLARRTSSCKYT